MLAEVLVKTRAVTHKGCFSDLKLKYPFEFRISSMRASKQQHDGMSAARDSSESVMSANFLTDNVFLFGEDAASLASDGVQMLFVASRCCGVVGCSSAHVVYGE